jgi:hypothetical protein
MKKPFFTTKPIVLRILKANNPKVWYASIIGELINAAKVEVWNGKIYYEFCCEFTCGSRCTFFDGDVIEVNEKTDRRTQYENLSKIFHN